MKRMVKMGFATICGGLLFALAGVVMLLFQVGIEGMLVILPIVIISIGGIIAINGFIILVGRLMARRSSAFAKEIEDSDKEVDILEDDERNIAISHKALATTYNYMNWLTSPLLIFLIMMQVELAVTLVFLAVLVARVIIHALLRRKYSKEM